ncbi:hypothetical protein [Psychrobacter sp. 16-MNA-CIBAN-0192]|uniref:hypothetical protein n=1 Tax=Psychrobacter sp. 16-MNA-CIBAN-0192 TaxID=3140448 RepID=UPI0033201992
MQDKKFTKASQAAAVLGLIPIQSLNPFSEWFIYSMSYQYMIGALYRHRCGRGMKHLGIFILYKVVESQTIPAWFSIQHQRNIFYDIHLPNNDIDNVANLESVKSLLQTSI